MSTPLQIGQTVTLPNGTHFLLANRQALRKVEKLLKRKDNRSRKLENNYILLEDQSFFAIDFTLDRLSNCKTLYKPGIGLIVQDSNGRELDLFYELHWFNRCWHEISTDMGEPLDLSPIVRLFRKVEAGMPIDEALHIDPCKALVMQCRKLYRKADKARIGKIIDHLKKQQLLIEATHQLETAAK